MKTEIGIVALIVFFVLIGSLITFNIQDISFTGFAVDEPSNVTKDMALIAITEAEGIIDEMIENNFSIIFMNDTLLEAKKAFERAEYAEILRDDNASEKKRSEAAKALSVINWKKITYADVLTHTNKIKEKYSEVFVVFDSIVAAEFKIKNYEKEGVDVKKSNELLAQANIAFYDERYEDSNKLLEELRNNLETRKTQSATLNILKLGAKNFIQRYWVFILIFLILISIIGFFSFKKINMKLLKKKIKKLKTEKEVLLDLMKKTQIERYKENKISGLVYNIRMEKYKKRTNEIKEILPVLEEKIKKKIKSS